MYFDKIQVAVIDLVASLDAGDRLIVEQDDNCLFEQLVDSMQIDRNDVRRARKGQEVGVKLAMPPKSGGKVWRVI